MHTAHTLLAAPTGFEIDRGRLRRVPAPNDRERTAAARLARLLGPAATALGGWTSTQVVVRFARDPDSAARPAVALCCEPMPPDGVVDAAPLLVALTGRPPAAAHRWLEMGTAAVWLLDDCRVVAVTATGATVSGPGGRLAVPGTDDAPLAVSDVLVAADPVPVRPHGAPLHSR